MESNRKDGSVYQRSINSITGWVIWRNISIRGLKSTLPLLLIGILSLSPVWTKEESSATKFETGISAAASTNVYSAVFEDRGDLQDGKKPSVHNWFSGFDLSGMKFYATLDSHNYGGRLTINGPSRWVTTAPDYINLYLTMFNNSYLYARFKDIAYIQVGLFENRRLNRLNSVVDEWAYGYVMQPADNSSGNLGTLKETDLIKNFNAEFYAGPVTIEFAPLLINTNGKQPGGDNWLNLNNSYDGTSMKFAGSLRVSAPVMDLAKVQLLTAMDLDRKEESPSTEETPNKSKLNTLIALGGHVTPLEHLELASHLSYTFTSNWDDWKQPTKDTGNSINSDMYTAVDIRGRWTGFENIQLELHSKFTYGFLLGKNDLEKDGANFLATWNALGGSYNITDNMQVKLVTTANYSTRILRKEAWNSLQFSIKPAFRYSLAEKTHVQVGINYTITEGWGKDNKGDDYTSTRVMNIAVPVSISMEL